MESIQENLKYLVENHPDKFLKLHEYAKVSDVMSLEDFICTLRHGFHIRDAETYNKMISVLEK